MRAALVAHADWSTDHRKRWVAAARREGARFVLGPAERVGDTATLLERLLQLAGDDGPVLVGFDFPIGLPAAHARLAEVHDFRAELPRFGDGRWQLFYDPARTRDEISPFRPFYPHRPGGTRRAHLAEALSVGHARELLRACEHGHGRRADACPLFWTLGGNQVGRAALCGWREVLVPALARADGGTALWPFEGSLDDLLRRSRCVLAETYPAEACLHLGLPPPGRGWSKRKVEHRRAHAAPLLAHAAGRGLLVSPELRRQLEDGFGPSRSGEDPFDAVVGLLSMVDVVLGQREDGAPEMASVRAVEGWILGQPAAPGERPA